MNCPRCNTRLDADVSFCGVCGASLPTQPVNASGSPGTLGEADATVIASWSGVSSVQEPLAPGGVQPTAPAGWQYGLAGTVPPPQGGSWPQQQPGGFQAAPGGSWPQQQPQQPWAATYAPDALNSTGTAVRPRRRRKVWLRVLISLLIVFAVLAGGWFLGLRPYLHNLAQTQLDQALDDAGNQITLLQTALPPGQQIVHASESDINNYLSAHATSQLQNLYMTITPTGLNLSFQAYNFNCTILAVPIASGGALQVTDVQVQGVLGLIISNDELTTDLNNHFLTIGHQIHRTITAIDLKRHNMYLHIT